MYGNDMTPRAALSACLHIPHKTCKTARSLFAHFEIDLELEEQLFAGIETLRYQLHQLQQNRSWYHFVKNSGGLVAGPLPDSKQGGV